jgi:uncharacterized protein YraI
MLGGNLMRKKIRVFWCMLIPLVLASCIQVELKDEREIPKFYEIALVTYTPSVSEIAPPTAMATDTPTITPTPTPTSTPLPSLTPISPTPSFAAVVNTDAACRQGPGDSYPGSSYLTAGELVILLGRNPEATWWLVQKNDGAQICWAANDVITLQGDNMSVAIMSALPTTTHAFLPQPTVSPTQKPRQRPPKATEVAPPSATDTPAPYPYPAP